MRAPPSLWSVSRPVAPLLALLCFGCGGREPTNLDQARETLTLAMEAWRGGQVIEEVSGGHTPIIVSDPAWKAGYKLTRYRVAETAKAAGFDLKIPVDLWLEDPKGKAVQEKARYTVSIKPSRTVVRAPF